ncbi:hypothetical protein E4T44_00653 [Aureobasidium sp. EXF-8845]|nr:hypothetical protein E4T44_00653 [Aureobasidium sp. EXF-8845]KAI4857879.1 hypothetical protein E4T45_00613 [Aureobasidium sp. EXF-8846]
MGIEAINAFELPLLNTVLLLASGVTITYSHHSLIQGNRNGALLGAIFTVFLAMIFTAFQGVEYAVSSFTISDGAYGSCFYFGTGFHGIHVIIGTIFLAVVPFYFVNEVTFAFAVLVTLIYVFSKYVLPRFVRLFSTRVFISKL